MKSLNMYCLSIHDNLYEKIKSLNYIPVGLGDRIYNKGWLRDNTLNNISKKNSYYGEYTFHYWFWKNGLMEIKDNTWIGFCAYRRFWLNKESNSLKINDLNKDVLLEIPDEWKNYDCILGNKIDLSNLRLMKLIKYGKLALFRNPKAIIKTGRSIRFQFDMFHGYGVLDKAINLLEKKDREDFRIFVRDNNSYNQGNMFICKSKNIINEYYKTVFHWLSECEKIFGFNNTNYETIRIYAFLAERFLPYWFNKYTKPKEWPIVYHDIAK